MLYTKLRLVYQESSTGGLNYIVRARMAERKVDGRGGGGGGAAYTAGYNLRLGQCWCTRLYVRSIVNS